MPQTQSSPEAVSGYYGVNTPLRISAQAQCSKAGKSWCHDQIRIVGIYYESRTAKQFKYALLVPWRGSMDTTVPGGVGLRGSSVCDFFFSSRRRHTRLVSDWSSDVCSSD